MPLPPNSTITLQGQSAVTNKPKVAMIVRMTEETLDALANLAATDRLDFEFGDKPSIHVQERSFPMRYSKEKDNQELFIRTTGARLNNPPLKLNANVIGKFLVDRDLNERLVKQIHNATAVANKQKHERKTIMLDTPPALTPTTTKVAPKKKTTARTVTKSTPVIVTKSYATPVPSQPPREATATSSSVPSELVAQYRQRLVHYLALGPATQADVVKNLGGLEPDRETRMKIAEILNDLAEIEQGPRKAVSASPDTKWQLKPQSWLQVRPYQYPDYTENVRTNVARSARSWLARLKISESDAAWEHVRFRNAASSSNAQSAPQRAVNGTMSTTAKKAKVTKDTKPKNQEVKVKSEATSHDLDRSRAPVMAERLQPPPVSRSSSLLRDKGKKRESEKEEGELSASETPPSRTPVHGRRSVTPIGRPAHIQVNHRLEPPQTRPSGATTPTMPPPASPRPAMGQQSSSMGPPKRTGPVDARTSKRPPPEQSERGHAMPPILPPVTGRSTPVQVKEVVPVKKDRPAAAGHRASGSVTLNAKERDVVRRERDDSDRESIRTVKKRDRDESDRESLRGVKRRERDESDRESGRVPKRERVSDRESIDGRERKRESMVARDTEPKRRERDTEPPRAVREREAPRQRHEPARERQETARERPVATTTAKTSSKRKQPEDSGDESSDWGYEDRKASSRKPSAKVKTERESPAPRPSSSLKARREPTPPRKLKRESPMPTKAVSSTSQKAQLSAAPRPVKREIKDDGDRSSSSRPSKRRRSPIYTSSDDEEEKVRPKKSKADSKVKVPPPPPPPTAASDHARPRASRPSTSASTSTSSSVATPVPTTAAIMAAKLSKIKHKSPREQYRALYSDYLIALEKLYSQRSMFEDYVKRNKAAGASSGSASGDSDGEFEGLLSVEEIEELRTRYQFLHGELEKIYKASTKL